MLLNAYLHFNGECEAAFRHYAKCLRGEIAMMLTYAQSPNPEQNPPGMSEKIMHARLVIGDAVLMGGDAPPQMHQVAQGFAVSCGVDTPAEAERVYRELSEGGTIRMPMQETFWALRFGMFVDRFGTPWMVNCERPA